MSDPVNDVAFEDILDSVRRLVKSHPVRPPEAAHRPPERLVLTSDLRVATPDADQGDRAEPARRGGDAGFDASHPSRRNQTLEARIAELEAAVNAQATDFEPDGSEDTEMHRPRAVPDRQRDGDPLRRLAEAHRDEAQAQDAPQDAAPFLTVPEAAPQAPRPSVVLDEPSHFRFRPRGAEPEDDRMSDAAGEDTENGGPGDVPGVDERPAGRRGDDDVLAVVTEIEKLLGGAGLVAPRSTAADDQTASAPVAGDTAATGVTGRDGAEDLSGGEVANEDDDDWEDLGVLSLGSAPPAMQGGSDPFSLLGAGGAGGATTGDGSTRPRSRAHLRAVGSDDFPPQPDMAAPIAPPAGLDGPAEPAAGNEAVPDDATRQDDPTDSRGAAEDDSFLDEDALREMVAELVRRELQGALGERISRNLRKLVRREIMRALSVRDFQ